MGWGKGEKRRYPKSGEPGMSSYWLQMDAFEANLIRTALASTDGALNAAARLLGVPKNFLLRRVTVLRITERRRRGAIVRHPAEESPVTESPSTVEDPVEAVDKNGIDEGQ
jgi:hypothetical protein